MPRSLLALAESQHGVVARHQLRDLGLSRVEICRLTTCHGWAPVSDQVLRREGSPATEAQRVSAAALDSGPGAFISFESGSAWWGHPGSRLERPVHTCTDRGTSRPSVLSRRHLVRSVDRRWVTTFDGVPVARPELVALHLFGSHRYERAERIVEALWSDRLLSGRSLRALLDDLGCRGRNGTAGLRRYVEERGDDYTPPASGLESRFLQVTAGAGLTGFRRQVDLGGADHWSARVDFVHQNLPLVVEVQSERHHTALVDVEADTARIAALESAGFVVQPVWDSQVWTRPGEAVAAVRSALAAARRVAGQA